MSKETKPELKIQLTKETAHLDSGNLDYLHIGQETRRFNPVVVVPGFTQGIEVLEDFGIHLTQQGQREVFVLDQLQRQHRTLESLHPLERLRQGVEEQADALVGFLANNELTDRPIDFVTNSLGASIAVRAAEIAHNQGWKSFSSDEGSRMVFISPAGSNNKEFILSLGGRFIWWMAKNTPSGKYLDPKGEMMKTGVKNALDDLKKTVNEVRALARSRIPYERLGEIGIKPFILAYPGDQLMPYRIMGSNLETNLENLSGVASVVGGYDVGARNYSEFKKKTGLNGKAAKEAWVHHYRSADHSDMQSHPERTASSVLQILN